MNKAVQFTQHIVGHVARRLRFAMHIDRHIRILTAHLLNEGTQALDRRVNIWPLRHLLVIHRQYECAGTTLLLCKLTQITVTRYPENLIAFSLDGIS